MRDLSKYKILSEDKLSDQQVQDSSNNFSQGSYSPSQNRSGNPSALPRGQTSQSFQHQQSLSQFQPKSLYAQKDNVHSSSLVHSQLPYSQQQHNYKPSTPTHEQNQYQNQNYIRNQTEQIHSHMQPGHNPQSQYSMQSKAESNPYANTNSRLPRPSVDQLSPYLPPRMGHEQTPPYLQPKSSSPNYIQQPSGVTLPNQHPLPNKYPPNQHPTNSSQSPCTNSVNMSRDSINGYRPSMDYSSQQSDSDKTAFANRLNPNDLNESYQRTAALRRNSKPVSGDSPYSFKQVGLLL